MGVPVRRSIHSHSWCDRGVRRVPDVHGEERAERPDLTLHLRAFENSARLIAEPDRRALERARERQLLLRADRSMRRAALMLGPFGNSKYR